MLELHLKALCPGIWKIHDPLHCSIGKKGTSVCTLYYFHNIISSIIPLHCWKNLYYNDRLLTKDASINSPGTSRIHPCRYFLYGFHKERGRGRGAARPYCQYFLFRNFNWIYLPLEYTMFQGYCRFCAKMISWVRRHDTFSCVFYTFWRIYTLKWCFLTRVKWVVDFFLTVGLVIKRI